VPIAEDAPLDADDIEVLFAPLETARGLALAVSGGADSTALMLAARRWLASRPQRRAVVLHVDHGLRAGSAAEARRVAAWAADLGFEAEILVWEGPKPTADVQAAARRARYRLLAGRARALGLDTVLTAHTRDDQAETFLLRLARGSGLQGLAGMRRIRPLKDLCLVRPFLDVPKARLIATCLAAGQAWIEDPSNIDPRFARARFRALRDALAREGLGSERLARTAERLRRAQDAVDWIVARALAEAAEIHPAGLVRLALAPLMEIPEEAALRALARVLQAVGGREHAPRLERLEALWATLRREPRLRRTLANCLISAADGLVTVLREEGREPLPALRLAPGDEALWDGRFRVGLAAGSPGALDVKALGAAARDVPAAARLPRAARRTLPSFWRGDALVAVPSLDYVSDKIWWGAATARFVGLSLDSPRQELASRCRVRDM
jgi:tRNA(Ile)-lysidine synthase